jgi:hypothetical protein
MSILIGLASSAVGLAAAAEPIPQQDDERLSPEDDYSPDVEEARGDSSNTAEDVAYLRDQVELLWEEMTIMQEEAMDESKLDRAALIYGFFDVTFGKFFLRDNSIFKGLISDKYNFMQQSLNLYIFSQLSSSTSIISELRFTYAPLGQENDLAVPGLEAIPSVQGGHQYDRVNTEYQNRFTDQRFRLGGVGIERLHLTWQPRDWFGVIAGRYLTPYGIWNIDHGAPVLMTIRHPYHNTAEYIPLAQTGLQFFGRVYPTDTMYLQYALTVSNGRGPIESIIDYDNDKGLGLRLRWFVDAYPFIAAVGAYGYRGEFTDIKRALARDDSNNQVPIDFREQVILNYTEWVGSLDLLIAFHGLQFQSEAVRGLIRYGEQREKRSELFSKGNTLAMQPDYLFFDAYGLISYTLPLSRWLGAKKLTPYFMYEYSDIDDSVPDPVITHIFIGGINFKPTPFVAIKLEYDYKRTPFYKNKTADFQLIAVQLAVSF